MSSRAEGDARPRPKLAPIEHASPVCPVRLLFLLVVGVLLIALATDIGGLIAHEG
ncbi:MAG TPA: hypothetical protein VKG24_20130 [Pseudolabrys sp.]|nr:hypothetical protein [Pseudolabrys sp.]